MKGKTFSTYDPRNGEVGKGASEGPKMHALRAEPVHSACLALAGTFWDALPVPTLPSGPCLELAASAWLVGWLQVIVEVAEAQAEDVDRAVKAAKKVRGDWTVWCPA